MYPNEIQHALDKTKWFEIHIIIYDSVTRSKACVVNLLDIFHLKI